MFDGLITVLCKAIQVKQLLSLNFIQPLLHLRELTLEYMAKNILNCIFAHSEVTRVLKTSHFLNLQTAHHTHYLE